jgi:hypothetical protein
LKDGSNASILNKKLVKENEILKAQDLDVNPTLTKLTKRKENVEQLLSNQICTFKKSDLRYKPIKNERLSLNFFVIASSFLKHI